MIHQRLIGPDAEQMRHPERINNLSTTWAKLYTLETARSGLLVNEREIGYTEDTLFNLYALADCRRISYVHRCLYHYRRDNGASLTTGYKPMLADKYSLFYGYIDYYIRQHGREKDRQRLHNRIACGMISLGLNEMNAPTGFFRKVRAIRKVLDRPEYTEAFAMAQWSCCPLRWKVFFFLCRYRLAYALTGMLQLMEWLRHRKNRANAEERGSE